MKLNNKGFTLVEVLAVIVILGLIGSIALTSGISSINTGKNASYKIIISDIVTASQTLYEEVEFEKSFGENKTIKQYTEEGVGENIDINDNKIYTNLQTLVSNGYLTGSENSCKTEECSNKNKRIITEPINKNDIGTCKIIIEKDDDGNYTVTKDTGNQDFCPDEYKKEVK